MSSVSSTGFGRINISELGQGYISVAGSIGGLAIRCQYAGQAGSEKGGPSGGDEKACRNI
jgi:hypothetical protein